MLDFHGAATLESGRIPVRGQAKGIPEADRILDTELRGHVER